MKRIRSILRGREGMTLVELVVGAGLLCLVIGIFSASLRPAAEVSRRTQELNSAELIADDLLETVRSKVETATDYIKCYDSGTDVTNKTGSSEGSAIEFGYETEQGYNAAELLTALICDGSHPDAAVFDPGDLLQQRPGRIAEEGLQAARGLGRRVLHGPVPQADELAVGEGGPAELDGKQMGVYRATEELYYAVELRCPHLGCQLEWNPDDKSWDCPCHGSRFDVQGRCLTEPAQTDLPACCRRRS